MASSVIHMCIAKKVNETLNMNQNMLLLGAIAPDLSKHVGETKKNSHFLTDEKNINIDAFLLKYRKNLDNPFIMGYFIHLYTDMLWDKYFITEIVDTNSITLLNGEKVEKTEENYRNLIYNDYTNLNVLLLDEYNLDLSLFYNEAIIPDIKMDEIPTEKLPLLIDQTGIIIQNTKINKAYTFKLKNIKTFIELSTKLIESYLQQNII